MDKRGLLRDGLDWQRKPVAATSVHSQILALQLKLVGHDEQVSLSEILLPYIHGAEVDAVKPSAYWVTYIFSALSARGHGAEQAHVAGLVGFELTGELGDVEFGCEFVLGEDSRLNGFPVALRSPMGGREQGSGFRSDAEI